MIDEAICKQCHYWSEKDCCGYFIENKKTRKSLGAYGTCTVFTPIGSVEKSQKSINSNNARREALKKLFNEGLSDPEISKQIGYAVSTIVNMRLELGLIRREHTTQCRIMDKHGKILGTGSISECARAVGITPGTVGQILRGRKSRKYIVEVVA